MKLIFFVLAVVASFLALSSADVYMHNPRGSNNRLNENTANRKQNNRMFDSQNNNRGGYNVGDLTNQKAGNDQTKQYRMNYFESGTYLTQTAPNGRSELTMEWTNQHGCGGDEDTDPHKQNCNIVAQYMCQDDSANFAPDDGITIRAGSATNPPNYNRISSASQKQAFINRRNADTRADRGLNEPWVSYDAATRRERNKGLFTATQNLNNKNAAINTRQNPNGNRNGYETPEERDYYPYWHPTVWTDIAVLAQNESLCSYYVAESFNSRAKGVCVEQFANNGGRKHFSVANNPVACAAANGVWTEYQSMLELAPQFTTPTTCTADHQDGLTYAWGLPYDIVKINAFENIVPVCFVRPPPVDCQAAPWSRSNHLGNGKDGVQLNYTWTLPNFPSTATKRCILRIRYNISTDDYDPFDTDATDNGQQSPVQENPLVQVGAAGQDLKLAINTAQFGRTFQDRGHPFTISPRPAGVSNTDHITNLNVRGKRGNIVQTFPATEYDFTPTRGEIAQNDVVHIQWTGSNSHNNAAPGGDGQTGDAGEGTGGTDRHNMLQSANPDENFPLPIERVTMFDGVTVVWVSSGINNLSADDMAVVLASSGYYQCMENAKCGTQAVDTKAALQNQLNNAPASFSGIALRFNTPGKFYFLCTRNNNFSNRSEKGSLTVVPNAK